ncbi:microtubule-associated protein [Thraustotheca clavata]|uniref:Microtubule-associated protein n=1 Tax=Thraustotheca clavata TaxID=74557 RepID=A0A1V9YXH4_9STRA|nr:microtubule-associated protein [Thraustotheca clavata]
MGQLHGKAAFAQAALPFLNVSEKDVNKCWESFNDVAEGFGINKAEMIDICSPLQDSFEIKAKNEMERITGLLFDAMDTDENELVDALEFLGAIAMLSAMTIPQKITFVYNCYDFNESGEITIDELTLSMKSTLTGLCKLSIARPCPTEVMLEEVALQAFQRADKHPDKCITLPEFIKYCETTPEVNGWINFFDSSIESVDLYDMDDSDIDTEVVIPNYTVNESLQIDLDTPNDMMYQYAAADEPALTQPWQNTVANAAPSSAPSDPGMLPSLELDWIYGMNSSLRQCLNYISTNEIMYPAASVIVLYDHIEHKQRYSYYHSDMVLSIAVHPNRQIIASGERGLRPHICIWDSTNMNLLSTIRNFHTRGIAHLAWTPDNRSLISIGMDTFHSVAIYQWPSENAIHGLPQLIHTERTSRYHVLALHPVTPKLFITCGQRHVTFWAQESPETSPDIAFTSFPGVLGKKARMQTLMSATSVTEKLILTGTVRGEIWLWEGRNVIKVVYAHASAVNVLHSYGGGVLSGGKDGKIRIWSKRMEPGAQFDILALGSYAGRVRSLMTNADATKVLVATGGAEIYELSTSDGCNLHYGPLVSGHSTRKLCGLATHPLNLEMCSVGDDKSIRIWDLVHHRCLRLVNLEAPARACVYSPDAKLIAVGYGSDLEIPPTQKQLNGAFAVLNEPNLAVKYEGKDSKKFISNIKFSSDGTTLAVCTENVIYMYNTDDWASKGKCKSKDPTVVFTHFDLSSTGEWLQMATNKGEIVYYDTNSSVENTRLGALKDVQWATFTSIFGWPVQGVWPSKTKSYEVTALNRSHKEHIIVCGDQFGHVRVFKYPALPSPALFHHNYNGHCGRISHVQFTHDDQFVMTSGEDDRCLFQWRVELEVQEGAPPEFEYHANSDDEIEMQTPSERSSYEEAANVGEYAMDLLFQQVQQKEGAPAEPLKPWVGSAIAPATAPEPDITMPSDHLEMEWVYGYRGHDCRNNVKYTKQGRIVYPIAKVVVVFETKSWSQRHFKQHQDEVVSIAMHPELEIIASGEVGKYPAIHIWHSHSLSILSTLRGVHKRGIVELAFNGSGSVLASAGGDPDSTILIYDWAMGQLLAQIKTGNYKILGLGFQPNTNSSFSETLVAVSQHDVSFLRISGRNITRKHAVFGKRGYVQPFLSVIFIGTDAVAGSTSGELYKFKGIELVTIVPAHSRSVAALYACANGSVCSGGRDGFIKIWTSELECLNQFNVCNQQPIRSILWNTEKQTLLVGTRESCIYEINAHDGSIINTIMDMHYQGQVQGLTVSPTKDKTVTTGDDGTLRIWDTYKHKCLLKFQLDTASRAAAYAPEGAYLAVGLGGDPRKNRHKKDGTLLIYEEKISEGNITLEILHETRDTKQPISVIRYSPDGVSLIVGAQDNIIYIYDVPNEYAKRATFNKHKSFITHFDISSDSQYLRSNCGGYELLFADLTTGSHVASATALKNQTWHTCTTIFNWYNQGAWPPPSKKTSISASSSNGTSLVVGDNLGAIKLYRFPCVREGLPCKTFFGHTGPVQALMFSQNSSHLFSVGLNDHALIQWKSPSMNLAEPDKANKARIVEVDPDLETEGWFIPAPQSVAPFGGTKPYLTGLVPPTTAPEEPTEGTLSFELEFVYGARLQDTRNLVQYSKSKRVVSTSGRIGTSYDRKRHAQAFYTGHQAPIISMAMSCDGLIIATGEEISSVITPKDLPRIHIWDPTACTAISILPTFHTTAITYLSFNETSTRLISAGKDTYHSLAVYGSPSGLWHDARIIACSRTTNLPVRFVACLPYMQSMFDLVTGGVDHIFFWRLDSPYLHPTIGTFGSQAQIQTLTCGNALDKGTFVTGTRTGHLYLWDCNTTIVQRSIPAHSSTVNSIAVTKAGIVSGSCDGHIKVWNRLLNPIWDFDMCQAKPACSNPIIRSIAWDLAESRFLVGTRGGEIYEVSQASGDTNLILESHYEHGLFGLAAHPIQPNIVATGGEDCTLRIWNTAQHELIGKVIMDTPIKAVAYSSDGKTIAVGLGSASHGSNQIKEGAFAVLDTATLEIMHEGRDSKQSISDIKFSPDGTLLAIGSHDNTIYLHAVMDNYALRSKCSKSTGHITHLDFSKDSRYLRANSDAFELIYVNTFDGVWISSPSSLRDVDWASYTCVLSWASQGIWGQSQDFIHAVGVSPEAKMMVSGNDKGELSLHSFPSLSKNIIFGMLLGHGGQVTGVTFNCDGTKLYSIGGIDRSLFQWSVQPKT